MASSVIGDRSAFVDLQLSEQKCCIRLSMLQPGQVQRCTQPAPTNNVTADSETFVWFLADLVGNNDRAV
jgi:hypothetical protein